MIDTSRTSRRSAKSRRFLLEWLEGRCVLSGTGVGSSASPAMVAAPMVSNGPDLTIVGIGPSDHSTIIASPTTLNVIFDRPLDPNFLGFGDIRVDQLQTDGSWLAIHSADTDALSESLDDTGTILELTLDTPLTDGTYRLVLPAGTYLAGLDGSSFASTDDDLDLGHFVLAPVGATLGDAADLGTASPTSPGVGTSASSWGADVGGSLDFTSDPLKVNLYKITVPAGHYWRFGAEVESQRLGESLQSAVTIFDSQGNVIRYSNTGRPSTPNDAYVFTGLAAGTYYIGVSGTGNLPGSLYNGYDPVTGNPGSVTQTQTGDSYDLKLSLDTADTPTQLVNGTLNFADPIDSNPTGLTLSFNGVLDATTVRGQPTPGFALTNRAGQPFPLTAVDVDEATGKYTFLFDNKLPAGDYTLSATGAKDLAGLTPAAPNQPNGVLMTFHVAASLPSLNPYNIGTFYNEIHSGVGFDTTILPGTAVTYRFVLTSDGLYHFDQAFGSGKLTEQFLGDDNSTNWTSAGTAGAVNGLDKYFEPGIYLLSYKNAGTTVIHLHWTIRLNQSWDSFFDNGIGQSSAMTLRLVDNSGSSDSSPSIGATGPVIVPASGTNSSNSGGSSSFGPFSPPSPANPISTGTTTITAGTATGGFSANPGNTSGTLAITIGDTLIGRPALANDHVSVVGVEVGNGSTALASSGRGIPQGIGVGQALATSGFGKIGPGRAGNAPLGNADAEEALDADPNAEAELPPVNGAMVFDKAPAQPKADEAVVAAADWLNKIGDLASQILSPSSSLAVETKASPAVAETIVLQRDGAPPKERSGEVQGTSLAGPTVVGFFTMASVRYYNKGRRQKRNMQTGHPSVIRGPHGKF